EEVLQQRAAAAERIRALMGRPKPAHDDIGADSGGEIKRLRERNEELENENACLQRENLALRSEIDELRARLPTVPPPADDRAPLSGRCPPLTGSTFTNSCGGLPHDAQIRSLRPQCPTRRSSPARSYGHADQNAPRRELESKPRPQWASMVFVRQHARR